MVGGSVRDQVMNKPCEDLDFTSSDAPRIAKLFADANKFNLIVLDDTPNRETYRVIITNTLHYDFTAMQGDSIMNDLSQRDFTMNAMALPLPKIIRDEAAILDFHGGQNDIKNKMVRALPGPVFESDPLRMLRAYRFAATMNFNIESNTLKNIENLCSQIKQVANERIIHELLLYLDAKTPNQSPFIYSGLLENIIPELKGYVNKSNSKLIFSSLEKIIDDPNRIFKEYSQDIKTYLQCDQRKALLLLSGILCVLASDENSKAKNIFLTLIIKILTELRMSKAEISFIERTLSFQIRALKEMQSLFNVDKNLRGIYNFVKGAGNELISSLLLASATFKGTHEEITQFEKYLYGTYDFYCKWYKPSQNCPALINGDDLTNLFNLNPSPLFKIIIDKIEEERVLKLISTREEAESRVKMMILENQQR
jgi:tRNA nucleotidyltransferase/poly(A) polymerase